MEIDSHSEGIEIKIGPAVLSALAEQGVALIFTRADLVRLVRVADLKDADE